MILVVLSNLVTKSNIMLMFQLHSLVNYSILINLPLKYSRPSSMPSRHIALAREFNLRRERLKFCVTLIDSTRLGLLASCAGQSQVPFDGLPRRAPTIPTTLLLKSTSLMTTATCSITSTPSYLNLAIQWLPKQAVPWPGVVPTLCVLTWQNSGMSWKCRQVRATLAVALQLHLP